MSTLIHLFRLKKIESEIQHQLYRVDKVKTPHEVSAQTDVFLERLRAWKSAIPQHKIPPDQTEHQVYRSYDSYVCVLPPASARVKVPTNPG
jgi:hypothetical protein